MEQAGICLVYKMHSDDDVHVNVPYFWNRLKYVRLDAWCSDDDGITNYRYEFIMCVADIDNMHFWDIVNFWYFLKKVLLQINNTL